jgi:geranylgeranyl pyrophosphate synthase
MTVRASNRLIDADLALMEAALQQFLERRINLTGQNLMPSESRASASVWAAMRDAVFGEGKRIRPLLEYTSRGY